MSNDEYLSRGFLSLENRQVVFLNRDGNSPTVCHQYNGVACSQFKEHVEVINLGVSASRVFDPEWWYQCSGNFFDEVTGGRFLFPMKIKWPELDTDPDTWDWSVLFNRKYRMYYPGLIRKIQREINRLDHGFYRVNIDVGDPNSLTEALIPATIYPTKYDADRLWTLNTLSGWVAWNNCD